MRGIEAGSGTQRLAVRLDPAQRSGSAAAQSFQAWLLPAFVFGPRVLFDNSPVLSPPAPLAASPATLPSGVGQGEPEATSVAGPGPLPLPGVSGGWRIAFSGPLGLVGALECDATRVRCRLRVPGAWTRSRLGQVRSRLAARLGCRGLELAEWEVDG